MSLTVLNKTNIWLDNSVSTMKYKLWIQWDDVDSMVTDIHMHMMCLAKC